MLNRSFVHRFASTQHAPFFRKFDPRAAYFDSPIIHLVDAGVIQRYFDKLTPFRDIKEQVDVDSDETKLILEHFFLAFLFCIVGLLCAMIVLISEQFINGTSMRLNAN